LGGSLFPGVLRGFDSDADGIIHFVKRLASFHSVYFTVRAGAIAQERGGPILGKVNVTKNFVFLYFSLFFLLCFLCWYHNWQ
jgi:hypothetical protein